MANHNNITDAWFLSNIEKNVEQFNGMYTSLNLNEVSNVQNVQKNMRILCLQCKSKM